MSLPGYSPWGCKQLDMTEQLTVSSQRVSVTQVQYPQLWNPFSLPSFIPLVLLKMGPPGARSLMSLRRGGGARRVEVQTPCWEHLCARAELPL